MKKLLLLFVVLTLMTGCVGVSRAHEELPLNLQRSAVAFDSVNHKMFGEVWRPDETMVGFDLGRYKEILASFKSERAQELREFLAISETQILRGDEKTFVFCVFSSEQGIAMCDDARCSGVERKSIAASPEILEVWLKELPLSNCLQH